MPKNNHNLIAVYTFNSSRKMMMTVIELKNNENERIGFRVFCKGASEILLNKCKLFLGEEGKLEEFSKEWKEKMMKEIIQKMAEDGLRTIAIGYKDIMLTGEEEEKINWEDEEAISGDLVGLAICGIQDPVREEVPAAIE